MRGRPRARDAVAGCTVGPPSPNPQPSRARATRRYDTSLANWEALYGLVGGAAEVDRDKVSRDDESGGGGMRRSGDDPDATGTIGRTPSPGRTSAGGADARTGDWRCFVVSSSTIMRAV